ncbi:MAG: tol-pal system protein YbgF [bacterium]|jgi:tol-pal system protein YbgF
MRAGISLSVGSLLAVTLFSGCGAYREYVRRGELLDSITRRLERIEQQQQLQNAELARLRADALTGLEGLETKIGEVNAELTDLGDRIEKIGRRTGAWRGELLTENPPPAESAARGFDTTVAGIDPDKIYNTAYLDFTRGNYQMAITGFRRFIQLFPASEMADNAQYWIGECFYSLNQLDSARAEFLRVKEKYPDGNKVPAALYKLGLIYQLEGNTPLAEKQFEQIINNYPASPEAKLAQERLKKQQ